MLPFKSVVSKVDIYNQHLDCLLYFELQSC